MPQTYMRTWPALIGFRGSFSPDIELCMRIMIPQAKRARRSRALPGGIAFNNGASSGPCATPVNAARNGIYKAAPFLPVAARTRSEEHTSELQSHLNLVCRLLLEK